MPEAVIVSATRSPIGRAHKGSLTTIRPDELAAQVTRAALDRVPGLDSGTVDDLILGCGLPGGEQGFNLGRVVAVGLGLDRLPGVTVNRFCSSSLQTTRMAMHTIRAGEGDVFLSVGVETVSRLGPTPPDSDASTHNPRYDTAQRRTAAQAAANAAWSDPRDDGEVPDVYIAMGQTAENVATRYSVSREDQDRFAARSQNLAEAALDSGFWDREITPVTLPDGTVVARDDGPRRGTTLAGLARLEPVFRPKGTVTAGNACPLNDGAAALVIMSDVRARELGLTPLARIVATGVSGLSPEIMGMGPVEATRDALKRAGMSLADVDLFEINEAFASQVLASVDELGLDLAKVNVHGGAIAIGHPFGMTGARITTTLLNGLASRDATIGLETMCVGGGQGMAMVLERLS
ncbi:acetyl-CoA acetyltransferase [Acrocarpospora pleiomorpha]|uniref:Acetyl-CoA acetyltransferase n=1 Tax=Acrocarpospora pleiomorpha TaxID=90975 RepID=A0A5M3X9B1_9ACTN|nr:acetyl-CoA C-acetyltransferase [Acrocarpospora pleiomorpha]GES17322.1 acetyl-CoA acetyltransferase [Acrocarpospora pleiomorpha]